MRLHGIFWIIATLLPAASSDLDEAIAVAATQVASGDIERALEDLRRAATTPEAKFRVAQFFQENSLPWQALSFSTEARESLPRRADIALLHGSILNSVGRFEEAAGTLEPLLSIPNAPSRIRVLLAHAYLRSGQHEKAVTELQQVREKLPDEPELAVQLAFAYLRSAEPMLARATLREAKANAGAHLPQLVDAMTTLTSSALRDGDVEAATLVLEELSSIAPREQTILLRANLLNLQDKQQEAIELIAGDPRISETAPGALVIGIAHYQLGRFRLAIEWFRTSLTKAPAFGAAEHHLGLALANLGQYADAEASHRKAVAVEPRNETYRFQLGWVLLRLNKPEDAQIYLRSALTRNPRYAPAWTELGRLALDEGKPEEAMRYLESAVEADHQFDPPYLLLSTACRRLNRQTEAQVWLTKFQAFKQQERDHRTAASRVQKRGM